LTSVDGILHAVGFLHGLTIDELREEKWKLKSTSNQLAGVSTKRSISVALSRLSVGVF
jgi:hypothetical protein